MQNVFLILCLLTYPLMAALPKHAIVFQPQFKWKDGLETLQGTGSFIRAPNGKVIGLTSAHLIDPEGSQLLEVDWLDIKTEKPVAIFLKSWGVPGDGGSDEPLDVRSDYLLLLFEGDICPQNVLELDDRSEIGVGERVWFPNKNAEAKEGYDRIEGEVAEVDPAYLTIKLDKQVDLQSRSGSPFISQSTGKVIGILARADESFLYLVPGSAIYNALSEKRKPLLLQDIPK